VGGFIFSVGTSTDSKIGRDCDAQDAHVALVSSPLPDAVPGASDCPNYSPNNRSHARGLGVTAAAHGALPLLLFCIAPDVATSDCRDSIQSQSACIEGQIGQSRLGRKKPWLGHMPVPYAVTTSQWSMDTGPAALSTRFSDLFSPLRFETSG